MSISWAPVSATSRISCRRASSGPRPLGNPPATLATFTPSLELLQRDRHELRVQADRRDGRDRVVERVRPDGFRADRDDLADRVAPLERGEVHRPDREIERPELRVALDRALRERGRTLLQPDCVDGGRTDGHPHGLAHRDRQRPARLDLRCSGHASMVADPVVAGSWRSPTVRLPRHEDRRLVLARTRRAPPGLRR